ncbi:hypothetical protein MKW92_026563 [Papaver armeniacum]|nr:hypothetical protein MKW92_026563 [Papaver armeniacum]
MVEAVVSFAVEKLGDAIIGKTFFLHNVLRQVEGLRDELVRMQCFLKDADAKEQQGEDRVRNWVAEIRNIAYDAEDIIDTFILQVGSAHKPRGIKSLVIRKALMVKNLTHLHRVGNKILAIEARLKVLSDSRVTYGIKDLADKEASSSETNPHPLRNRYPHVEDEVLGFEKYTETLLTELMKDDGRRCVVSVVGVGGLGKTTLAKKMYRHNTLKSHFNCCGWSSISQQLNVGEVLGEITACMSLQNEGNLMEKLYNYLQDKRYFVVLDDVWKIDHWNTLSPAFPIGKRGSKILLTTRNKEVALHADPWSLHLEPQFLNDNESWELLRKKAFPRSDSDCYPDLEKLGREMVRKCGGLPLAVCVLGGLLATKRSEIKQWELVHKDVISYINRGEDGGVNGILALSYHDLPSQVKPCFLYLGLFPEDYAIPTKQLIQLWIAEGFIPHTEEHLLGTMEDIGKRHYLAALTQRCMIQLGKGNTEEGIKSVCRVHDLIRDLSLSKGKEINFLSIYNLMKQRPLGDVQISHLVTTDACRRVRRYATHFNNSAGELKRYEICFNESDCAIRTLMFVVPGIYRRKFPLAPINYQNIKLLRVLDLGCVGKYKTDITKEVSKLIHLRYLDLGDLNRRSISSSISNLGNLQTLKLFAYKGQLPETASRLVNLRHLDLFNGSLHRKFRIENLINLHTIYNIRPGKWIRKGCFEKLTNLRKLSVFWTTRLQTDIIIDEVVRKGSSLSSSSEIQYQNPIRSLSISTQKEFPSSILDSLSCCHKLHKLYLYGKLDIVNLQKFPPNLTQLSLNQSFFMEDPMGNLQYLPKLRNLTLYWCKYEGEEMVCSSQGFPELKYLNVVSFENVKDWRVDRGGMPRLKEFHIEDFPKLSMLPEGLKFITTLEKLEIKKLPLVKERVAEGAGEDWYKVQHIPSITTWG